MSVLRDETAGIDLATRLRVADTHRSRLRGLAFRGSLEDGEALLFRGTRSIHMMFMRFRIDAVFFDEEMRVTRVHHRLRPWLGFASGGRQARGVVELASGAAGGVAAGDQLTVSDAGQR